MPFGILDTRYIDLPAGIDEQYLRGLRTRAGVEFATVLREIDSRIGALNRTIDPLVAALLAPPTTEQFSELAAPIAFDIDERGEYTVARPQLVEGQAIMLPIRGYDVSLGFTEDGLESMSLARILQQVDSLFLGFRKLYRRQALQRLFSDAEVRVAPKTTVTSPGFAGSGTGDNVFSRSYPDGTALPAGYTHYYAVGAGTLAATLLSARNRIAKWHPGPFDLIAPQSQIDLIMAINPGSPSDGFVSAGSALVRPGQGTAEAVVDADTYLGVLFGNVRVRTPIEDTSSANIAIFKTYGAINERNALAWRYDDIKGRDAIVRSRSMYPLDQSVVKQDFGIGVNDRTAAVLIENGAAPYTEPTWT